VPFTYKRRLHFSDTDAAGVVFFARYLSLCHEAYEECLLEAGIHLQLDCPRLGVVLPIRRSEADYLRPLVSGEEVSVTLTAEAEAQDTFGILYELTKFEGRVKRVAVVRTVHVCLDAASRERRPLPAVFCA
jgi:1,4-dihydroxy-2-naphthoyl-CoA hydrolase